MSPEHESEPIFVFLHTPREETMSPGLLSSSVQKNENRFGFAFKNRTIHRFEICSITFLTATVRNTQFKLKVTKITLLAFSADKERLKTLD